MLAHKLSEFSDGGVIRGCLGDLASELGQLRSLCERRGRRLHILVGSDHGSTLLPTDAAQQQMPQTTREIDDLWEPASADREIPRPSSRAAVISDPDRVTVDESAHWYILGRERFQLDRHYAVPRGEGYIGRRPEGWTHGGLTPEEVIVPLIRLSAEMPRLLPIEILIEGSLRARQEGTLEVTLINPNRLPLDDVQLRIADAEAIVLDMLSASSSLRKSVQVAAPVTSASELPVRWAVSYRVMGDVHRHEGSHTVPVRRLSVDESGFDDLFGE
jgi:hypothetical protein